MRNGERRLSGRPGRPKGLSSSTCASMRRTAVSSSGSSGGGDQRRRDRGGARPRTAPSRACSERPRPRRRPRAAACPACADRAVDAWSTSPRRARRPRPRPAPRRPRRPPRRRRCSTAGSGRRVTGPARAGARSAAACRGRSARAARRPAARDVGAQRASPSPSTASRSSASWRGDGVALRGQLLDLAAGLRRPSSRVLLPVLVVGRRASSSACWRACAACCCGLRARRRRRAAARRGPARRPRAWPATRTASASRWACSGSGRRRPLGPLDARARAARGRRRARGVRLLGLLAGGGEQRGRPRRAPRRGSRRPPPRRGASIAASRSPTEAAGSGGRSRLRGAASSCARSSSSSPLALLEAARCPAAWRASSPVDVRLDAVEVVVDLAAVVAAKRRRRSPSGSAPRAAGRRSSCWRAARVMGLVIPPGGRRTRTRARAPSAAQTSRKRLIASRCRARNSSRLGRDAEALLGRQAQHADLALVQVLVDVVRRLAGLARAGRSCDSVGWIRPAADEPVGLPALLVVGEVRADDALEVHPEVAVVVAGACSRWSTRRW